MMSWQRTCIGSHERKCHNVTHSFHDSEGPAVPAHQTSCAGTPQGRTHVPTVQAPQTSCASALQGRTHIPRRTSCPGPPDQLCRCPAGLDTCSQKDQLSWPTRPAVPVPHRAGHMFLEGPAVLAPQTSCTLPGQTHVPRRTSCPSPPDQLCQCPAGPDTCS